MAISSIGVGSGLPLDKLLENLRANENNALALINTRAKAVQGRLSSYGTIKGAIEAFKSAADALGKAGVFNAVSASAGGNAYTAAASPAATPGEYRIEVMSLATRQSFTGAGQESRKALLSSGDLTFTVSLANGSSNTLTVPQGESSLEGIAKAINSHAGLGVKAALLNDGSAAPYRLLLTASSTGTEAALQSIAVVAADGAADVSGVADLVAFDLGNGNANPNLTETAATNARLTINGVAVSSQGNTITQAIDGVTLNLTRVTTPGAPETLTLTPNNSIASAAVKNFVDTYNTLQGILKSLTGFNAATGQASPLTGDSLARSAQSELRGALNAAGSPGAYATLAQIGITTDPRDGKLVLDDARLAAALQDNMAGVQKLFTSAGGIAARASEAAGRYTGSGGRIGAASDSMTAMLNSLEKEHEATSGRINMRMEAMRKQFVALDATVARMNSLSAYLTQQLSQLKGMKDK